jgi:two-component system, OmpR family, sensor histidine kinase KdpD
MRATAGLRTYVVTLVVVAVTLAGVGLLQATAIEPGAAMLLYLVPVILAASRWGRAPAVLAVLTSLVGHDLLYVEPRGTLTIQRAEEALGLVVLLLTALVTAQLAAAARRHDQAAQEAAVARRSDELKTALLRAVTHDLRTPLASIKASVSALRQPGAAYTEADRTELLTEIEEESDRLERLVRNLLDASRVEAGSLRINKRPQDMRELVTSAVTRVQPLTVGREMRIDVAEDLPPVGCDYQQIEQVVVNLLENAAVHTPARSRIVVAATSDNDCLRVEIADNGPGIPAADRERLFGAFERGSTAARGSGLGLAIARGFVEAHGGRIWVEDAPAGGARLVFTLPLASAVVV